MKKYIIISVLIATLLIPANIYSQVLSFTDSKYKKPDRTFKTSNKSRDLKLKKGASYKINLKLKKSRLYYVSVRGNKVFKNVQYQLKTNNKKDEVLYDNAAYEFNKYNTFRVQKDTVITLEIKTQPALCFECNKKKRNVDVLIAYKKIKRYEERKNTPDLFALAANN